MVFSFLLNEKALNVLCTVLFLQICLLLIVIAVFSLIEVNSISDEWLLL